MLYNQKFEGITIYLYLKCLLYMDSVTSGSDPRGTRNADSDGRPKTESD